MNILCLTRGDGRSPFLCQSIMLCKPLRGPLQREEGSRVYKGSLGSLTYALRALKWLIWNSSFFKIFR
jgi:hypothetical protein